MRRSLSSADDVPMEAQQRLLTVREVAELMRVSNMTVYRLIRAGELAATRVGRGYRVWDKDVASYLVRGGL